MKKAIDYDKIAQYHNLYISDILLAPNGQIYSWHPVEISDLIYNTQFGSKQRKGRLIYPYITAEKYLYKKGWRRITLWPSDHYRVGEFYCWPQQIQDIKGGKLNQEQLISLFNTMIRTSFKKGELIQ